MCSSSGSICWQTTCSAMSTYTLLAAYCVGQQKVVVRMSTNDAMPAKDFSHSLLHFMCLVH